MPLSILDFFTIGIGPSSSHTVGPMRAAAQFVAGLIGKEITRIRCELYGSLAATGKGHGTHDAILLGFLGESPESVDLDAIPKKLDDIRSGSQLQMPGGILIPFSEKDDLIFHRGDSLPRHPNGMKFTATINGSNTPIEDVIYSTGGGFIVRESDWEQEFESNRSQTTKPFPFETCKELLAHCEHQEQSIANIALANELALREETEVRAKLDEIWAAMQQCVERGCTTDGALPGGLKVQRRAKALMGKLQQTNLSSLDPLSGLDWVNLYALAVNEENAAGGRVVTAPTNGAAGIIPAVLHYAERFTNSPHSDPVHRFLLTAGAIAILYKKNASISGADVGCQGEVGVACSMAAGGLVEWLGGTPDQVECAAEIGMEHNLGLTCDPVGGLVQIPCIERNAMGSVKAINAARLAMSGDGSHVVSLDKVIKTMRDTGRDMMEKYKETSRGGLAVNVVEC